MSKCRYTYTGIDTYTDIEYVLSYLIISSRMFSFRYFLSFNQNVWVSWLHRNIHAGHNIWIDGIAICKVHALYLVTGKNSRLRRRLFISISIITSTTTSTTNTTFTATTTSINTTTSTSSTYSNTINDKLLLLF